MKSGRAVLLPAAWLLLPASPAGAARTQPEAQRTYWDQLMEAQAARSLYRGARLLDGGDYEDAVRYFARAVLARPADPLARQMLGVAYYWSGQVDQALAEFQESLKLDAKNAQTHLLIGIVHAWKGKVEESYASFREAARLDPKRADVQMNLGSIQETRGKYPDALDNFRRAVELDGKHPLYRFQLGMIYRRLGRFEEAAAELHEALRLFPGYQDAMLELGAIREKQGRPKEAAQLFDRAVRTKPRDTVARFRLARAHLASGREEKARQALRDVFHLTPSDRKGGLALSMAYGGAPQPGEGLPSGTDPAAPGGPMETPGRTGSGTGPVDPLDVLERNLHRIPLDQEAMLQVDMAFLPKPKLVKRKAGEAPSALREALEKAGRPPAGSVQGVRREYALSAGGSGDRRAEIEKVMRDLREAMASAPPDSETRVGMNLSFSEKPAAAAPQGRQGRVSYNPHDVGNDLGLWVMGNAWMGLIEEELSDERRESAPGDPMGPEDGWEGKGPAAPRDTAGWWVTEGVGFAALGKARRAAEAFARALRLDPNDDLAYLGLGVARVISGDEEGAAEAYRKALEINPKNRTAEEGLKWLLRGPADQEPKAGGGR